MKNKKIDFLKYYNVLIIILVIFSITLVILDLFSVISLTEKPYKNINIAIIIFFWMDYVTRFSKSDKKVKFLKSNIPDLLAILALHSLFSLFRTFRIFSIAKIALLAKFSGSLKFVKIVSIYAIIRKKLSTFVHTNGFNYILYCLLVLILSSSVLMSFVEHQSFSDSLWWSIVTVTTVGYGDIAPSSTIGRVVAVILMLFGIGFIGMLTSTITTYFSKIHDMDNINAEISSLVKKLDTEQKEKVLVYIKELDK